MKLSNQSKKSLRKKTLIGTSGALALFGLTASNAFASGYSDPVGIGSRAIGMGGAFVGIADDATAIYHNPAAISLLKGHHLTVGMDAIIVDFNFTPPAGTKESADHSFNPAPTLFYTKDLTENVTAGIGVYFPHGVQVEYGSPSANPLNPNKVSLYTMEIAPTIAVALPEIPGLSLGMGVRAVRISSSIEGAGFVLSQSPLILDTLNTLEVNGWTVGASFSALYKPIDWLQWGTVYRTRLRTHLEGDGELATVGAFNADLVQTIPGMLTSGLGIMPSDKLKVGIQYDFEQNSQNQSIDVVSPQLGAFSVPQNWSDTHTIHIGANYKWCDAFDTSVGYARDFNEAIPDSTSDRSNTDFDAHFVSAGLGFHHKALDVAAAWKGFFGDNSVDATNPIPGEYETFSHTVSLQVGANF